MTRFVGTVAAIAATLLPAQALAADPDGTEPSPGPEITLPIWNSSYAWGAGDGYAGWRNGLLGTASGPYGLDSALGAVPGL